MHRYLYPALAGVLVVVVLRSPVAQAGIIEVGPFVGDLTETWESFPTTFEGDAYLADPSPIMGGAATISNEFMFVYEPSVSDVSLGNSGGYAQVSDGVKGMNSREIGVTTAITFDIPVVSFGAYWGAITAPQPNIGDPAIVIVSFYDTTNSLLGTGSFSYRRPGDGILEWHGWASDLPIKYLTYHEDGVAVDGLQGNIVPEPATSILVLVLWFASFSYRNRPGSPSSR